MKKTLKVTLLGVCVLCLISLLTGQTFAATSTKPNKVVMSADQIAKKEEITKSDFSADVQISRNTSLYDHQDGTRKDGVDYLFVPRLKTYFGTFKAKIAYSQDLKDESASASDWADAALIFSMSAYKWNWSQPYIITLTPFFTGVIPISQASTKRDEYKTGLSTGLSIGIIPDGIAPARDGAFMLALSITAGQNFHAYSSDINGKVLNKYSSNQTFNLGYTYKEFNVGFELINKSRWSYEGNTKNSFAHSEELGYSITDHFNVAIGHSNEGGAMKANASDSNFDLINENDSMAYGTLGISF
jgi:hypothetical protein